LQNENRKSFNSENLNHKTHTQTRYQIFYSPTRVIIYSKMNSLEEIYLKPLKTKISEFIYRKELFFFYFEVNSLKEYLSTFQNVAFSTKYIPL